MTLADFQDAWNQLLFDEKVREQWSRNKAHFSGLSDSESKSINSLPEERINLIAPGTVRGRSHVFFHSIPRNIKKILSEEIRETLSRTYTLKYPSQGLHPHSKGFVNWLKYIKYTLLKNENILPHLEDILNYEIKLAELIFYRIPIPVQSTPEPHLASWAGLFSAGPHFKNVLENLNINKPLNNIPDYPKHGYLLTRGPNGIMLEHLHWTIFEILNSCNGEISWRDIVEKLIKEEISLASQTNSLIAWEKYYLKEGIIYV